jgi:hypothetical protein
MVWFSNRLSIPILARTMGRPMYGDYTRSGRSLVFRLLLLTTRLIILVSGPLCYFSVVGMDCYTDYICGDAGAKIVPL